MENSSSYHMKVLDNNSEARKPHLHVGCSKCTANFKFGLHIIYKESRTDVNAFTPEDCCFSNIFPKQCWKSHKGLKKPANHTHRIFYYVHPAGNL